MAHWDPQHPFSLQAQADTVLVVAIIAWPHIHPLCCCALLALEGLTGAAWGADKGVPQCHQPWPSCPQDLHLGEQECWDKGEPCTAPKGHQQLLPGSVPHHRRDWLCRASPCPWRTQMGLGARTPLWDTRGSNTRCGALASAALGTGHGAKHPPRVLPLSASDGRTQSWDVMGASPQQIWQRLALGSNSIAINRRR